MLSPCRKVFEKSTRDTRILKYSNPTAAAREDLRRRYRLVPLGTFVLQLKLGDRFQKSVREK